MAPRDIYLCPSCVHWTPTVIDHTDSAWTATEADSPENRASAPWGTCTLIGHGAPDDSKKAYTRDGSDYWSALVTRRDFGCVEWKHKGDN
jgi:hypothetical protein